jgi:hypothetical protein
MLTITIFDGGQVDLPTLLFNAKLTIRTYLAIGKKYAHNINLR